MIEQGRDDRATTVMTAQRGQPSRIADDEHERPCPTTVDQRRTHAELDLDRAAAGSRRAQVAARSWRGASSA